MKTVPMTRFFAVLLLLTSLSSHAYFGSTPVQILSSQNLELSLDVPSAAQAGAKIQGVIYFPVEKHRYGPVTAQVIDGKILFRFSVRDFRRLSRNYAQSLGEIKLYQNRKELLPGGDYPQVFIGGDQDWRCRKPIMFSDFDGTLDRRDSCSSDDLNRFVAKERVTVFVVSTRGAGATSMLNNLQFTERKRFAVLDNMIGAGGGGSEKALRMAARLYTAGACILGMAGDNASVDGEASKIIDLPFLAVNQRNTTKIVDYKVSKKIAKQCTLKHPQVFELPATMTACPAGYETSLTQKIWCRPSDPTKASELFFVLESDKGSCEAKGGTTTGKTESVSLCSTKLFEKFIEREDARFGTPIPPKCPPEYNETDIVEEEKAPIYGAPEPSLDMTTYPRGSIYSENWCQLTQALSAELKQKRNRR